MYELHRNEITLEANLLFAVAGIRTLTLNRPDKLNALNLNLYQSIPRALNDASETSSITVITGWLHFATELGIARGQHQHLAIRQTQEL